MRYIITILALYAGQLIAGGASSGGTPPSREQLQQTLMSQEMAVAGLFTDGTGTIDLGINGELDSSLFLSKNLLESRKGGLNLSETDFGVLQSLESKNVDAVNLSTANLLRRSYRIEDGDNQGELILKDRRALIRGAVQ